MEKKRGDKHAAMAYFVQQRHILETLLGTRSSDDTRNPPPPPRGGGRGGEGHTPLEHATMLSSHDQRKLEGQLLAVLLLMRTVVVQKEPPAGNLRFFRILSDSLRFFKIL